jgi:transcriptional regulator GlxA family with amidase domain
MKVPDRKTRNVAIVLYQGVEILDFGGPAEVFSAAASFGADRGVEAFDVYTVASSREPVVSQGFIDIIPDYAIADAPPADIVVIPGGASSSMLRDDALMAWINDRLEHGQLTMTVCTGAMAPGSLGAFDGLTVTTHHSSLDHLQKLAPKATVEAGRRFIDNGSVLTTAGVSAGIDGALHVVAKLHGRKVADDVAWYMEYAWTPDGAIAQTYSYLDPSRDERGQRIQSAINDNRAGELSRAETQLRSLLAEDDSDGHTWTLLTENLRRQHKWSDALEAARRARDLDASHIDGLFLEGAVEARMGHRDEAFAAFHEAVDQGFNQRWRFENDTDLDELRTDPRFGDLLASLERAA